MKCSRCGTSNRDDDDYCKECGWTLHSEWKSSVSDVSSRRRPLRRVASAIVALAVVIGWCSSPSSKRSATGKFQNSSNQQKLSRALAYERKIPEVQWMDIDGNNVYIGFARRPVDLEAVIDAAAIHGRQAIQFPVHAWAVDGIYTHWRPGDGPYWLERTQHDDGSVN